MTNAQMWALIVGAIIPPLIAVIQQPDWPSWARSVVGVLAAIIVGLGTVYFAGDLDLSHEKAWISSVLLVLVTSIATYKGFWQNTVAPRIEAATSGSRTP